MATEELHVPALGPPGEGCAECGAPLAPDQRYCLACGARRAEARVPPTAMAAAAAPVVSSPPVLESAVATPAHERATVTQVVAALGCLLLALGVGVLIGRSGGDGARAETPPLQVVTVAGAAGGAAGAGTSATDGGAAAGAAKKAKASKAKAKDDESSAKTASTGDRGAATKKLADLEKLSPEQYQKQSQKLPKQVGTGGKPQAIDPSEKKKAAGGGSEFQEIG